MNSVNVTFEAFCKAYFITHRRDEGFRWEELDRFGRQWWEGQARRMWEEISQENAA
jgi:hypothetical protein